LKGTACAPRASPHFQEKVEAVRSVAVYSTLWRSTRFAMLRSFLIFLLMAGPAATAQQGYMHWAKAISGQATEYAADVAVMPDGGAVVCGSYNGRTDLDPGPDSVMAAAPAVEGHSFVSRFDSAGNLLWARVLQGTANVGALSVATDAQGGVYVAGLFAGTMDANPSATATAPLTSAGMADGFVLKLDATGAFVWVRQFGGEGGDVIEAVRYSSQLGPVICGNFEDTASFISPAGAVQLASAGKCDGFVARLSVTGDPLWMQRWGGAGDEWAPALALHDFSILVGSSFEQTVSTPQGSVTVTGLSDAMLASFSYSGSWQWMKTYDGGYVGEITSVSVAPTGVVWCAGSFSGAVDFDPGPYQTVLESNGSYAAYASRFDVAGNFVSAVAFTIPPNQMNGMLFGTAIAADATGGAYVGGAYFGVCDLDPGTGQALTAAGENGAFLVRLSSAGGYLGNVTVGSLGGFAEGATIASGKVYWCGSFGGSLPAAGADPTRFSVGNRDAFLAKGSVSALGFENVVFSPTVSVFPNPATEVLGISLGGNQNTTGARYRIYSAAGVAVAEGQLSAAGVDIRALPPGVYAVEVSAQGGAGKTLFTKQ